MSVGNMRNLECSVCGASITKASSSGKCYICSQRKVPYKRLYNKIRNSAERKGQKVELSYDEFLLFTECKACHYCEGELKWVPYGKTSLRYNLDRIDATDSYSLDNCVPCCWMCNEAKGNRFSYVEFMKLKDGLISIRQMREHANSP